MSGWRGSRRGGNVGQQTPTHLSPPSTLQFTCSVTDFTCFSFFIMSSLCHRQLKNDGELTHVGFFKSGLPLIVIAHLWRLFIPNQPIAAQSCRLGSSLRLCFIVAPSDPHTKSGASITCASAALQVLLKGGEVQRARTVSDF